VLAPHSHATSNVSPTSQGLITEKYPGTMLSRGPHGGGSTGEKKLASSSDIFLQPDLDCGRLTADRTRWWYGVSRIPKVRWKSKYLLAGTVALIVYGIMRLRLHVSLALLLVASATEPVVEQCPSYTEYSKVDALDPRLRQYRYGVPRAPMERRQRAHLVSHICGQTQPIGPSQVPRWR
jgi:hypothetical protein